MGAKPSTHLDHHEEDEDDCCSKYERNTRIGHKNCRTQFGVAPRPGFVTKCGETKDTFSPSVTAVQQCQPYARPELRPESTRVKRCQ